MPVRLPSGRKLLYFDYNATTPIDEDVIKAMTNAMKANWGNPRLRNSP